VNRILGIDLGRTAVKLALVEASFRSQQVRQLTLRPLGPETLVDGEELVTRSWAERTSEQLAGLAAEGALSAELVVTSLPAAQVATHVVTLPFGDVKRIDQALPFELEGLLPFDLDDVVFDAHVLSRSPSKTELFVAVARREDVAAHLALLGTAGVDPLKVTFSASALVPLASTAGPGLEALVDIGDGRTGVLLSEGGKLAHARVVPWGGRDLTKALAKALSVSEAAADELKVGYVLGAEGEPATTALMDRAAATLVRELRATFAAHAARTGAQVSRIVLTGGGARLAGLAAFVEAATAIPTRSAEASAAAGAATAEADRGALALSLALSAATGTGTAIDLRRGPFATQRGQSGWRDKTGVLTAMAAVLLLLLGVSSWAKLSALEKREKGLDEALCAATKKILGTCETDFRVALGKLKGKGSPAAGIPSYSAVDLSKTLSEAFPPGDEAVLNDLDIVDATVTMRGDAKSYESVDKLVESLQKHRCFGELRKGNMTKGKNDRIEFKLDAPYNCGATKKAGS
jgi:general secretion pathway protein L